MAINLKTGEVLSADSTIEDLSEGRRAIALKINELKQQLEEIDKILMPHIELAAADGEKKFANYWDIRRTVVKFSKKLLDEHGTEEDQKLWEYARSIQKELEDKYKEFAKPAGAYLQFPKY